MKKENAEKKVTILAVNNDPFDKKAKSSFQFSTLTTEYKMDQSGKKGKNIIQWSTQIIKLKPKI